MKKFLLIGCFLMVMSLLLPLVVLASYNYYVPITIYNNNTGGLTGLPILVTLNNSQLASMGYILTSGLDTEVQEGATSRPYSVVDTKLGLFIPSLLEYQSITLEYRLGVDPPQGSLPVIVGVGGNITFVDSNTTELGDNFKIEFQGYINTSAGANKNIIFKDNAFKIWISAAKEISASVYNAGWTTTVVTATDILSGMIFIEVSANVSSLFLYVNSNLKDTASLPVPGVPNVGTNWMLMQNNSVAYLEYFKIWVG